MLEGSVQAFSDSSPDSPVVMCTPGADPALQQLEGETGVLAQTLRQDVLNAIKATLQAINDSLNPIALQLQQAKIISGGGAQLAGEISDMTGVTLAANVVQTAEGIRFVGQAGVALVKMFQNMKNVPGATRAVMQQINQLRAQQAQLERMATPQDIAKVEQYQAQVEAAKAAELQSYKQMGDPQAGELLKLQPHGSAPANRSALNLSGNAAQSMHMAPQAAMRNAAGYNPSEAFTVLGPKQIHAAMDKGWKSVFQNMRGGPNQITAQQLFDTVAQSINNTPGLTAGEKLSLTARLHVELFVDMKLTPGSMVRRPYSPK
ncbi:MAG TPA: hypothetical protein VMH05_01665 [Bryobacteraceae bacterium]|nr:hypothetical protein [Bryobacteraceae bacterium]